MASLGTVCFLSVLALKHLVIDVFLSGDASVVGAKAQQPLGLLSIPNKLPVHMHTIDLAADIENHEHPVIVQALNSSIVGSGSVLALEQFMSERKILGIDNFMHCHEMSVAVYEEKGSVHRRQNFF